MVVEISMLLEWILLISLLQLIFLRENNNHILLKDYFQSYNSSQLSEEHMNVFLTYPNMTDLSDNYARTSFYFDAN